MSEEDRARLNQAIKQEEEKERAIGTLHSDLVQVWDPKPKILWQEVSPYLNSKP